MSAFIGRMIFVVPANGYGVIVKTIGMLTATGMVGPRRVAGNHRHDRLAQSAGELIALDNECGAALGRAQVRIGKQH